MSTKSQISVKEQRDRVRDPGNRDGILFSCPADLRIRHARPAVVRLAVLFVSRFYGWICLWNRRIDHRCFRCELCFTFPYFKLNFAITGYPLTFVAMLAVACSVSALTTQIKKQEQMRAGG